MRRSLNEASLEAHSWLGLALGAAMYLICLSGALAVFNQEFERWEQPAVLESEEIDPRLAERALENFVARHGMEGEHWFIVFPTSGIPRLVVENDEVAHFVNADGSLGAIEASPWTAMLIDLHYYLHMPSGIGMIVVSACGAMLLALILSGVFAHRRIIKDAFRFRRGGNGTQGTIDLHNRLSVWGLPFHVMISVTGAYYGLAGILVFVAAHTFFEGDLEAVTAPVFTPEPTGLARGTQGLPAIARAVEYVLREDPQGKLVFLTVHEPGTEDEFVEIFVQQPGRLIYAESYRFDRAGEFIERGGYLDGPGGKQLVYSLYRLHFGDFAGVGTKLLYGFLGLGLAIVSATGISIWLAKRKREDVLNAVWPAFVWGVPLALTLAAIATLFGVSQLEWAFWGSLLALVAWGTRLPSALVARRMRVLLAGSLVLLVVLHGGQHAAAVFEAAAWPVYVALLLCALLVFPHRFSSRRSLELAA